MQLLFLSGLVLFLSHSLDLEGEAELFPLENEVH